MIDRHLDAYPQWPDYPFAGWAEDASYFGAVRAFFSDLFKLAAGATHLDYEDVIEPRMSADFSPFDVALHSRQRRVELYPASQECGFSLVTKFATDDYEMGNNLFGEMPDRSWLTISTDFNSKQLVAIFEMISIYTGAPFTTLAAEKQMERNLIKSYGHLFDYPASKRKARKLTRR